MDQNYLPAYNYIKNNTVIYFEPMKIVYYWLVIVGKCTYRICNNGKLSNNTQHILNTLIYNKIHLEWGNCIATAL